jgi:cation transport protein ChaC
MKWIFGYGSLIWRPSFDYSASRPALLRGWHRQFWQGSPDHRGTPGAPGRVVTLVEDHNEQCWGVAFDVEGYDTDEIVSELDVRESGGYVRLNVQIEFSDRSQVTALTYFAPPQNPNFLGPAPTHEIARQIKNSSGRSGDNTEYVVKLAEALRGFNLPHDDVRAVELSLRDSAP